MSSSSTEREQTEAVVAMPQMGVSVAEGTLAVWHKRVGDWIERDEIICEVASDKIDTDVPSPAAGRIVELLVAEDETVPVGTPLARIARDATAGEAHPDEQEPGASSARAPEPAPPSAPAPAPTGSSAPAPAPTGSSAPAPAGAAPTRAARASRQPAISPVVQRIAAEHGIDPSSVHGTGRGGRVRKQDLLALIAQRTQATTNGVQHESAPSGPPAVGGAHAAHGTGEARAGDASTVDSERAEQAEPLSRMRRAIAEHMTRSLRTAAHCTTITEADFSRVERERAQLGISPLPFVARATIEALQRHPALNATLEEQLLTRHRDVNLGIAVSLGERGLIVPVVHRAQELSIEGLAARISELARRARDDLLRPDEVRGGTFTITNPGSFGSLASTPIINQPQVAILDLEAVIKRPVVVTDAAGGDAIAIRPMANLCLSWDHRALDGALAAQFLATLRLQLEGGSQR